MNEMNNAPELDLSDEETVRRLVAADVMKLPAVDKETVDIQEKIKKLQKQSTYSIKLNQNQVEDLQRKADAKGITWKEFLEEEIQKQIFGCAVGKAVINRPSYMVGGRVSGPTGGLVNRG